MADAGGFSADVGVLFIASSTRLDGTATPSASKFVQQAADSSVRLKALNPALACALATNIKSLPQRAAFDGVVYRQV